MTRYWAVAGTVLGLLLVGFLVAEALDIPLLADPTPWVGRGGLGGALLVVALLTLDAVLPVPASLVMVASGALYGTVTGALLALLGRVLMALSGYAIGKRGGPLVTRLVPPDGRQRADGLLRRWGGDGDRRHPAGAAARRDRDDPGRRIRGRMGSGRSGRVRWIGPRSGPPQSGKGANDTLHG